MESTEQDFMGRGYLLPSGCKDLIDALHLKTKQWSPLAPASFDVSKLKSMLLPQEFELLMKALKKAKVQFLKVAPKQPTVPQSTPLPLITGQIVVPAESTVSQLAALLGQQPFQIVADVLELGFFVTAKDALSFDIISVVARKHGFLAIKPAA